MEFLRAAGVDGSAEREGVVELYWGGDPPLLIAPKGVRHRGSGCCVGNERGAAFLGTGVWVLVLVWEMGFF